MLVTLIFLIIIAPFRRAVPDPVLLKLGVPVIGIAATLASLATFGPVFCR